MLTRLHTLTWREREVFKLVKCGLSNRQIARQLELDIGSIRQYVNRGFRKMNIRHRLELVGTIGRKHL